MRELTLPFDLRSHANDDAMPVPVVRLLATYGTAPAGIRHRWGNLPRTTSTLEGDHDEFHHPHIRIQRRTALPGPGGARVRADVHDCGRRCPRSQHEPVQ